MDTIVKQEDQILIAFLLKNKILLSDHYVSIE